MTGPDQPKPNMSSGRWPWDEACCGVMASSLGEAVAVLDASRRVLMVNTAFEALLGAAGSGSGTPVLELFPQACRAPLEALLDACTETERSRGELELPGPGGARRILAAAAHLPGAPSGMTLLLVDVTALVTEREERNRCSLDALRSKERDSRALLDAILDSMFLLDSYGVILDINDHGARKMASLDAVSVIGRNMGEFIPQDVCRERMARVRRVIESGQPMRFEDTRNSLIFDNNILPVLDDSGTVTRVAVFARDITQQRGNMAHLRRQAFQQGVVAELGLFALASQSLDELMDKTCRLVSTLFGVELTTMLELTPEGDLLLRAGVGWRPGSVGSARVSLDASHSGLALKSSAPVIMEHIDTESRFAPSQIMREHAVVSGMSVAILGAEQPYGTLGVHSLSPRRFTEDEVHTLQSVANVLSEAVARLQAEQRLETLGERNAAILRSVGQGIFGLDLQGRISFANPAVERLTGYTSQEMLGNEAHWLFHHTRPDGSVYPLEDCPLEKTLKDGKLRHITDEVYWRKDGSSFPVEYFATPLFSGDKLSGAVVVFEDITDRVRAQERLRRQAFFDELTGLPNRAQFKRRLDAALTRPDSDRDFAVLFLDLDDFKVVNDGLGHTLGDSLLMAVSLRLRRTLGPKGMLARMGGDEFAILLEEGDCAGAALDLVERIRRELARPEHLQGYELFVSASVGVVLGEGGYKSSEDVLRDADTAMFKAKSQGKGESCIFDKAMHSEVRSRLILENDLRRALERGELFVAYQPLVSLPDGRPTGFEALMRWKHPERGLVSPAEFIPVAEASGLILNLGEWILSEACTQLARWRAAIPGAQGLSVSVNLSGRQFMQADLTERVGAILRDSGLPSGAVKLEITESAVMQNAERAVEMLGELKKLGLQIMIDDFGTGYSSLAYLRRFPVDALKVDRSFVRNLDTDRDNRQIVRAIVQLAASLELSVVAEGIERREELETLGHLGCTMGQGYLFARPLGAGAAQEYLKAALAQPE
ncbi:EAL and GGDEF domain-containing protein [Fundidesulfovibrio soli]|uniref:sensor domain-containing protein n=1 Tax=Fundidesulfovibrio soli TaxID=2922716 RepID=UPI001FAEFBC2|nr:EAL domain-containing protein [Fundidesulfovibrio soli]